MSPFLARAATAALLASSTALGAQVGGPQTSCDVFLPIDATPDARINTAVFSDFDEIVFTNILRQARDFYTARISPTTFQLEVLASFAQDRDLDTGYPNSVPSEWEIWTTMALDKGCPQGHYYLAWDGEADVAIRYFDSTGSQVQLQFGALPSFSSIGIPGGGAIDLPDFSNQQTFDIRIRDIGPDPIRNLRLTRFEDRNNFTDCSDIAPWFKDLWFGELRGLRVMESQGINGRGAGDDVGSTLIDWDDRRSNNYWTESDGRVGSWLLPVVAWVPTVSGTTVTPAVGDEIRIQSTCGAPAQLGRIVSFDENATGTGLNLVRPHTYFPNELACGSWWTTDWSLELLDSSGNVLATATKLADGRRPAHAIGASIGTLMDLFHEMAVEEAWLCVPHAASNGYVQQMAAEVAQTIPDRVTKVYFEYSNETWNTVFAQNIYCREQGLLTLAAEGNPCPPGTTSVCYNQVGDVFYARRSSEILALAGAEFRNAGKSGLFQRVLAGQAAQPSHFDRRTTYLTWDDPSGAWVSGLPAGQNSAITAEVWSIAPYFGTNIGGPTCPETWAYSATASLTNAEKAQAIFDSCIDHMIGTPAATGLLQFLNIYQNHVANHEIEQGRPMSIVCYEGGQHLTSREFCGDALSFQNTAKMGMLYDIYLGALENEGIDMYLYSTGTRWSECSNGTCASTLGQFFGTYPSLADAWLNPAAQVKYQSTIE